VHVEKRWVDIFREIPLSKGDFHINYYGDVVVYYYIFPDVLLRLMNFYIVNSLVVYLLALKHLLKEAILLSDQVERPR
jgi:hypothetical protein